MQVQLINSVKTALDAIIAKENIKTPVKLDVIKGSDVGDGYISKNYAVSIKGNDDKTLNLFVKYLPEETVADYKTTFINAYQTERRFYEEIYPEFTKFQLNKKIKNPFNNTTVYYKTNIQNGGAPLIIMKNLKCLNYVLRDVKNPIDDSHLKMSLKAFARFHAISYALKDQDFETYKRLTDDLGDFFSENFETIGLKTMLTSGVNQFIDSLDPILDKIILEHCANLSDRLCRAIKNNPANFDEYAVISQGDCRSNNLMFLYNDQNQPIDVKLIDWQCIRHNSPLLDFSYLFYTLSTKESLDKIDFYLDFYYQCLCERITELGSDPKKLFPREIFINHWRKCAPFGLAFSFCIIKLQLFEKDEIPDLFENQEFDVDSLSFIIKNHQKFIDTIKVIVQHFIDNNLI